MHPFTEKGYELLMTDIMVQSPKNYNIGITWWARFDEIGSSIETTLINMGHKVQYVPLGKQIPDVDILLTFGPFGPLTPVTNQLAAMKPSHRPIFVLWLTEQFPNPNLPEWFRYPISIFQSEIERACYINKNGNQWQIRPGSNWALKKGLRFRYYGQIHLLRKRGIRTILVIPSKWTADFLHQRGFDPVVACIRTLPWKISASDTKRDIPVLWLGKTGSKRRKRLLHQIRGELSAHGIEIMVVDGVENPFVWGEERTKLLNRTKIALNLLREPWDDNSLRYFFTAENHVLVVSEPSLPHSPFLPGIHIVEAPTEQIPETICYYLSHDEERKKITDSAKQLVTNGLTLENSLSKILKRVEGISHETE